MSFFIDMSIILPKDKTFHCLGSILPEKAGTLFRCVPKYRLLPERTNEQWEQTIRQAWQLSIHDLSSLILPSIGTLWGFIIDLKALEKVWALLSKRQWAAVSGWVFSNSACPRTVFAFKRSPGSYGSPFSLVHHLFQLWHRKARDFRDVFQRRPSVSRLRATSVLPSKAVSRFCVGNI